MSALLLNLLIKLGKSDKMRGLPSILSHFSTSIVHSMMLDYNYHMALRLVRKIMFGILSFCSQFCYGRHNISRKSENN